MALHTRQQFAELVGLPWDKNARATIATWSKRGNINVVDDLIDDTDKQNAYWIKKQLERIPKESNVSEEKPAIIVDKNKESTKKKAKEASFSGPDLDKYALDAEKKALEIEKLKVDTRIQELKEQKIRGDVIPIILVKQVFSAHTQSIVTSQKDAIEYLLINFSKEAKLTGSQLAKLRGKMVEHLNNAVEKAIKVSEKNIKVLMEEFSIKREIGEHD